MAPVRSQYFGRSIPISENPIFSGLDDFVELPHLIDVPKIVLLSEPNALLGIRFNLGDSAVGEVLREDLETCLPLTGEVGQELTLLQEVGGDGFVDDLFVVGDYCVGCQRLVQRRRNDLKVTEALELLLLLNASAVCLFALHEQFPRRKNAGNLGDRDQIGPFNFIVKSCVGLHLLTRPLNGLAF